LRNILFSPARFRRKHQNDFGKPRFSSNFSLEDNGKTTMDLLSTAYYSSPIGWVEITADHAGIASLLFVEKPVRAASEEFPAPLRDCLAQLEEYFKGKRQTFDLPMVMKGTEFQVQVWDELQNIQYAKLTTYKALAHKLKNPAAVRAIGNANSRNKLCLIIPCHRVVGSDNNLVGYAGGLWRKEWLIEHEATHGGGHQQLRMF
jgi:methylated-DNA-[protein]-cysteine S-methyltransferase